MWGGKGVGVCGVVGGSPGRDQGSAEWTVQTTSERFRNCSVASPSRRTPARERSERGIF